MEHRHLPQRAVVAKRVDIRKHRDELLARCSVHAAVRYGHAELVCPNRKPPVWAVKRPARPYKSTTQTRFTTEDAKGA